MSSEGNLDGAMNLGEVLHDEQMPLGGREPYPEGSTTALMTGFWEVSETLHGPGDSNQGSHS